MTTMCHAMPEATVLYSVTAVVVVGLVIWVLVVLKTAKQPWARAIAAAPELGVAVDSGSEAAPAVAAHEGSPTPAPAVILDADSTARATPVAIASEGRAKRPKSDAS